MKTLQMTWKKNQKIPIRAEIVVDEDREKITEIRINGCSVAGDFEIPNKDFLEESD